MIDFAWPWLVCFLPLPLLFLKFIKPHQTEHVVINASTLPYLALNSASGNKNLFFKRALLITSWLLLIIALMRPQWLGEPVVQTFPSRDILVAIDISKSMQIKDMTINGQSADRLAMVKSYLLSFIKQRQGDRIALELFADHAYLFVPFTQDWEATGELLDEVNHGLAGNFTAIGEAITLAVKKTLHDPVSNKTLILLSDGRDTVNTIDPEAAAALAKASGLKIYTVGIGADPTESDSDSDLDETTLENVATITGGQYFRARSEQDLSEIYQQINLIEPLSIKTISYQPKTELLVWPLSCLLIVMSLLLWMLRND